MSLEGLRGEYRHQDRTGMIPASFHTGSIDNQP
jgi:hypothetical protein